MTKREKLAKAIAASKISVTQCKPGNAMTNKSDKQLWKEYGLDQYTPVGDFIPEPVLSKQTEVQK